MDKLLYLDVVDKHSRELLGRIDELSRDSLVLIASQPLDLKRTRDVVIDLPDTEEFAKDQLALQIEAIWLRPDDLNPQDYSIGCKIVHIERDDLNMLSNRNIRQQIGIDAKRSSRKNLLFYLEISNQEDGQLLGHLGDLSADGVMLITEQPMPIKQQMKIRIRLPHLEEFAQEFINVMVETRWTKPDSNPDFHCTGCLFLDLQTADRLVIEQVQDILGFDEE